MKLKLVKQMGANNLVNEHGEVVATAVNEEMASLIVAACAAYVPPRKPIQTLGEMEAADPMVFSNERCR